MVPLYLLLAAKTPKFYLKFVFILDFKSGIYLSICFATIPNAKLAGVLQALIRFFSIRHFDNKAAKDQLLDFVRRQFHATLDSDCFFSDFI